MIVMGCHKFKDEMLIERQWATRKTNEMSGKLDVPPNFS